MSVSIPKPSSRLLRAAVAERADLVRHRERLTGERARLLGELRELDAALGAVDRRLEVLAELAGPPPEAATPEGATPDTPPVIRTAGQDASPEENTTVLRSPAIREAALRVLIAQTRPIEALHYRQ